ncbi:2-hydroxy-3-keto-5-methylthiopentenyl-1-phosphate phosphatase [Dehalogenimonas alkenigignens]|uniref:2-hydroxy-3-keto-5-methylthiopentenyl-1-phosphate phosphatase n=1 Tax=Dehalogenimonas alkenigignens TaxID=1217799 RepID=A0A0W0GJ06_9CHLR|nr:HAD-IB family phosphatase [Dehalogenimonas alkenigignens]KTB48559.1 2-hydroxy-3-keto-5-methylthiopentenyl-1-phosphate phosphatase [Dehalogenimonas alkenigignens]
MQKTLLQCDFDGTLTEEDVSFLILDRYAEGDWRAILKEYQSGTISVGAFNNRAFSMVKQEKKTLETLVCNEAKLRPGLIELVEYCRLNQIEMVIVSNGLDFYIRALLEKSRLNHIRVIAATTAFTPSGLDSHYIGSDGGELMVAFKEHYTEKFIERGFRVFYAGNGPSDIPASKLAVHTFATDSLLDYYIQHGARHTPFKDLRDIVEGLKSF